MRLLLLHGLGGNAGVWDGVARQFDGEVIAPDLAGHGNAAPIEHYDFDHHARDLLERLGTVLADAPFFAIGHSLGGATAIALAALAPNLPIRGIVAVGVKTFWPPEDVAVMHRIADKGTGTFPDFDSGAARFLRVSGREGLAATRAAVVRRGLRRVDGQWRLAVDPEAYRISPAPLSKVLARVDCPVIMASGEHDPMAPPASLAPLGRPVVTVPGVGHNAHVEAPAAILDLLEGLVR